MKYRVKLDMAFVSEATARGLMDYAKSVIGEAVGLNGGEETGYADLHLCGHDQSPPQPCQPIERVEVNHSE